MARSTLFKPPENFENRIGLLKEEPELDAAKARLLMQVELAFALMALLQLDDEPVTSVWALLSGTPIRHHRLQNLTEAQRRAIANTRQIVPFSAKFSWVNALRIYRELPEAWRNYNLQSERGVEIALSDRIICSQREIRQPIHQHIYKECLSTTLPARERALKDVSAKEAYEFKTKTDGGSVVLSVQFEKEQLSVAQSHSIEWFSERTITAPISISLSDLAAEAEYLDQIEEDLTNRHRWAPERRGNWVRRFESISFQQVEENRIVEVSNQGNDGQQINLDGFLHVAGMVGSGKSTVIILLSVYLYRHHPLQRITLVVSDVLSAIRLANQINHWFFNDPEQDTPVAVPILGKSQQDKNLRRFLKSGDYLESRALGQPHWGERWLGTACPLQSLLSSHEMQAELNGQPLIPGNEPCHSLKKTHTSGVKGKPSRGSYGCPFFATCPSKQSYRDLPKANIWITTPGGMAMGGLPHQLDRRPIKVGELVYERSDIVVFDEIETITQWFDKVYAQPIDLVNGKDGVFDNVSVPTEEYMRTNRVPPLLTQRWTGAERDVLKVVTATLTMV